MKICLITRQTEIPEINVNTIKIEMIIVIIETFSMVLKIILESY